MFQTVLGELDTILTRIRLHDSLEKELADILVGSASREVMEERLARLAESIVRARDEAREADPLDRLRLW